MSFCDREREAEERGRLTAIAVPAHGVCQAKRSCIAHTHELWVYYSAQIYLVGAEFTWVYAHRFGSKKGQERVVAAEVSCVTAATGSTMEKVAPPPGPGLDAR
jgi:hypothetical protein